MGPTCRPYLPLLALHLPLHYPGLSLSCPCLPCYTGTQDLSHLSPLPYIYLCITLVYHCLAPVFPAILVPKILVISPPNTKNIYYHEVSPQSLMCIILVPFIQDIYYHE